MARLFISHSSADNPAAMALAQWLAEQGFHDIFLDIDPTRGLVAGERWQEALKAAADRCEAVLFLVSPAWLASRWCLAEFLLSKTLHKRIFGLIIERVAPDQMPTEMTSEWQLCELAGGDRLRIFIVQAPGGPTHVRFREAGLDMLRRGLERAGLGASNFPWPPSHEPKRVPYRGLKALEPQDAAIFFGRDAEMVRGMDRIRGMAEGGLSSLLVILGPSGSGKSSFLRAGLWPRLLRDDVHFLPLPVVRPEAAVLTGHAGLAASLAGGFARLGAPRNPGSIKEALVQEAEGLPKMLDELLSLAQDRLRKVQVETPDPVLILPLDQAEELFAPNGVAEAEQFLAMMAHLLLPRPLPGRKLLLLATIRSDRFELMQNANPLAGVRRHLLDLPPISSAEFKSVIEGPAYRAREAGYSLDIAPALTARLIADAHGADALPLLAFTLERLAEDFGRAGPLTVAEYEKLGGVQGAIEAAVAGALAEPGRAPTIPVELADQMRLLRTTMIPWLARVDSASGAPLRRVANSREIPDAARPMVERLVAARLLVADMRNGTNVVEIAHESLLRNWPVLRTWLEADSADLAALAGVERASDEWHRHDRDDSWLDHRAARLQEVELLQIRFDFAQRLGPVDLAYMAACRARETAEQQRNAALQQARLKAEQQAGRRTKISLVVVSILLCVASGMGIAAWYEAHASIAALILARANHARMLAMEALTRSATDTGKALAILSESATRLPETARMPEVESAARAILAQPQPLTILLGHTRGLNFGAFSPDGTRVLTVSDDYTARLWSARTGQQLATLRGHNNGVTSASFSPDGARIVTASNDHSARIWDAQTGRPLATLLGHTASVNTVVYSPDGARILTASFDNTARLWDARTGQTIAVLRGHSDVLASAAFSPDGRQVVTASKDTTGRLWDAHTGLPIAIMHGHTDIVQSAVFSPDSSVVVTASNDHTARLWDARTGKPLAILNGHTDGVWSAEFNADGSQVVTASRDHTARLWDGHTGKMLAVLQGHNNVLWSAKFSPDGTHVVTASLDRTARLWDVRTGQALETFRGHSDEVTWAAFSPDGARVITTSGDNSARLWSARAGLPLVVLQGHTDFVQSAEFSLDNSRLLTSSDDGTSRIWDVRTGRSLALLQGSFARFSLDGTRVVTAGFYDSRAQIWDALTGQPLVTLEGHTGPCTFAMFSPDATRVVTASEDHTARVWDTRTGRSLALLSGHNAGLWRAMFSPDGTQVVTSSVDHTARLWDAQTGHELATLNGHTGDVRSARFSPDGTRVVTASADHTARLWDAHTGQRLAVLTGHTDGLWSAEFSPDGSQVVTSSADRTARLWDAGTGRALAVLEGHSDQVGSAAFSPDGLRVVTGAADHTAWLWDAHTGDALEILDGHSNYVRSAVFSPNGALVATASFDHTARVWDAHATSVLASLQEPPDTGARFASNWRGAVQQETPLAQWLHIVAQPVLTADDLGSLGLPVLRLTLAGDGDMARHKAERIEKIAHGESDLAAALTAWTRAEQLYSAEGVTEKRDYAAAQRYNLAHVIPVGAAIHAWQAAQPISEAAWYGQILSNVDSARQQILKQNN